MSQNPPSASSFRSPLDFTVGGCIIQNTQQVAQLRDRYSREMRALDQQERMRQSMEDQEKERYRLSLEALQRRQLKQQRKEEAYQQALAMRRTRDLNRTAQVYASVSSPLLLPFSSHFQRMPPPLAGTARKALNQTRTMHRQQQQTMNGGSRTTRVRPFQRTNQQSSNQSEMKEQYSTSSQQQDQHRYQSSDYDYVDVDELQRNGHNQSYPSHRPTFSSTSSFQPSPPPMPAPLVAAAQTARVRHGYGPHPTHTTDGAPNRGPPPTISGLPDPYAAIVPDLNLTLPYSETDLKRLGHEVRPHPFYQDATRLVNQDDKAYEALLEQRYPKHLHPPPQVVSTDLASSTLPMTYNLNGWSVEWGAGIKKSRETKTMEFLLKKKYI